MRFTNAVTRTRSLPRHPPGRPDGVFEVVDPGDAFTYRFPARPYGMQLYHCH